MDRDLAARARDEGLSLLVIAENAVAAAVARTAGARWDAKIDQACEAHSQYLAGYGSLRDHLQAQLDGEE